MEALDALKLLAVAVVSYIGTWSAVRVQLRWLRRDVDDLRLEQKTQSSRIRIIELRK